MKIKMSITEEVENIDDEKMKAFMKLMNRKLTDGSRESLDQIYDLLLEHIRSDSSHFYRSAESNAHISGLTKEFIQLFLYVLYDLMKYHVGDNNKIDDDVSDIINILYEQYDQYAQVFIDGMEKFAHLYSLFVTSVLNFKKNPSKKSAEMMFYIVSYFFKKFGKESVKDIEKYSDLIKEA